MAGTFWMYAASVDAAGKANQIDPRAGSFACPAPDVLELFERVDSRLNRNRPLQTSFPWFFRDRSPKEPSPIDSLTEQAYRPKPVLESLQMLERELQQHAGRYPSSCQFWLERDGERVAQPTVELWYKGRPCRLFSDAQGCWAVETTPGPREGIHHDDLKELAEVTGTMSEAGPEVVVGIERTSFLGRWSEPIASMKRVCVVAMQAGGWVVVGGE